MGGDAIGVTWGQRGSKVYSLPCHFEFYCHNLLFRLNRIFFTLLQKRGRDDEAVGEEKEPAEVLKSAGETGKGLMRSIYLLKAPRLTT